MVGSFTPFAGIRGRWTRALKTSARSHYKEQILPGITSNQNALCPVQKKAQSQICISIRGLDSGFSVVFHQFRFTAPSLHDRTRPLVHDVEDFTGPFLGRRGNTCTANDKREMGYVIRTETGTAGGVGIRHAWIMKNKLWQTTARTISRANFRFISVGSREVPAQGKNMLPCRGQNELLLHFIHQDRDGARTLCYAVLHM